MLEVEPGQHQNIKIFFHYVSNWIGGGAASIFRPDARVLKLYTKKTQLIILYIVGAIFETLIEQHCGWPKI
jgi:hypothetical protein